LRRMSCNETRFARRSNSVLKNVMVGAQYFAYRFDRAGTLDELTKLSATWIDAAEDRRVRLLVSHLFHETTHRAIYNRATMTTTCNVVVETYRGRVTPVDCGLRTGGVAS